MGDSSSSFSAEAILLAVVPKIPATLSMLGSGLIMHHIARRRARGKRLKVYHRIMFFMSCGDMIASAGYFSGTFPIPEGTVGSFGRVYGAIGTHTSCRVCGVWTQLQVLSPLYNGILALYYLLVVKCQWREEQVQAIEPYMHALPLLFALSTAIAGAVLDAYGSVDWLCWIDESRQDFKLLRWLFLFAPVWICWLFVSAVMFILYITMRKLELANRRYATYSSASGTEHCRNNQQSRQIAVQGMLYVGSFYITWLFPSIQRILGLANVHGGFALQMLDTTLLPFQGLLNSLIYARPRFRRLRERHVDLGFWQIVWAMYLSKEFGSELGFSSHANTRTTSHRSSSLPAMPQPPEMSIEGDSVAEP